ncbi:LacI family DNA-binding transcriptional regulator [Faunimonas pinastri]|nr:LacI family DNA-binding transcriptional regulator [Faunimonas pinastri]
MTDVARLAGVSVATVSRSLAGSPLVTGETRERIEAAVRETGYVVNHMAQRLRLQESRQILALVPDIANPFFAEVLVGVEGAAHEAGFNVLIGNTADDPRRADLHARQLLTGGVDGMLLMNGRLPDVLLGKAHDGRLVAVVEPVPGKKLPTVEIDQRAAAGAATEYLAGLGHRRIAHITGVVASTVSDLRLRGYRDALARLGLAVDEHMIAAGDYTIAGGEHAMARLLASGERPTAVFCSSDETAIGAIKAIRAGGLSTPGDISVMGFDDIQIAAAYDPPLTTIRQPKRLMGAEGFRLLADRIAGTASSVRSEPLPFELVIRASCAPPK